MAAAIGRVARELDAAFRDLDGWAGDELRGSVRRLPELRGALEAQAERVREMDRVLASSPPEEAGVPAGRATKSDAGRRANLARLRETRRRTHDDLMGTLAWIRELVSMIHLARFTGAPPSRAEELVRQIADAVEGLAATR
jgi:hypothetical protein